MVECLTRDWRGCKFELHRRHCNVSLSNTLYPLLSTSSIQEDPSQHDWKIVEWDVKNQNLRQTKKQLMLRLHYVPGGHDSYDFSHHGRNGVTVTQCRGTGSTNVAHRGCHDRRDRFLNSQKICHGRIDLLKCAVVERGERNETWRNVTDLNTTWSMSVVGRLVTRRQSKVGQGLSSSVGSATLS